MTDSDRIPQLLTIEQLAERLSTTVRHIRRLVAEKRIPYRKVGKLIRFSEADVAEWMETTRRPDVWAAGRWEGPSGGVVSHDRLWRDTPLSARPAQNG